MKTVTVMMIVVGIAILLLLGSTSASRDSYTKPVAPFVGTWHVAYPANPSIRSITFTPAGEYEVVSSAGKLQKGKYDDKVLYVQGRKDSFAPYVYVPNDESLAVITLGGAHDVHIFSRSSSSSIPSVVKMAAMMDSDPCALPKEFMDTCPSVTYTQPRRDFCTCMKQEDPAAFYQYQKSDGSMGECIYGDVDGNAMARCMCESGANCGASCKCP